VCGGLARQAFDVDEELIARGEIVGLLFAVTDIAYSLGRIETLLVGGEEDAEEEADEG
jgi:hypothetical protein